jgi:hypothetical protein
MNSRLLKIGNLVIKNLRWVAKERSASRAGLERRGLWQNLSFFRCTSLVGKKMAKKIELNKKTLRVLSVDELAAVAGGTLDSGSDTSLRTIDGPDTWHLNSQPIAPPPPDSDTP